jgi:hypothetical protein
MFGRVKLHACMTIAGSNIFVSENPKFWGQSFVRSLLIFFLIINFLRLSALCNALKCSHCQRSQEIFWEPSDE